MGNGYEAKTGSGYLLGEVVSALQKCIRRGLEREALFWALEVQSGFSAYLWRRLVVIVAEDIGGANNQLVQTVCLLKQYVDECNKRNKDKSKPGYDLSILGHVILEMARSPKSREGDDFVNEIMAQRRHGWLLDVPDFALDQHTKRGREMGRGPAHFWSEGAKLENEAFPSQYEGWSDEFGDGYHTADGKKARSTLPVTPSGQPALIKDPI